MLAYRFVTGNNTQVYINAADGSEELIVQGGVALFLLYQRRQVSENYLFLKLLGYTLLGGFTFSINELRLPLGFVVFLIFFRPGQNKQIKQLAAYLGLLLYLLQLAVPVVENYVFERPREIPAMGSNLYTFDFTEHWRTVRETFDMEQDAALSRFDAAYDNEQTFSIKRNRIEGPWLQYGRSVSVRSAER